MVLINTAFRWVFSFRLFVFMTFCIREAAFLTAYIWDMISFGLTPGSQSVSSYSANLAQWCKYKPCAKSYADICLQYNPIWLQLEKHGV